MDKLPLQSKKFIAYLVAEVGSLVILIYMVFLYGPTPTAVQAGLMVNMMVITGFRQVGYILGQAALDRYVAVVREQDMEKKNAKSNHD
jgi:hypothetical protein